MFLSEDAAGVEVAGTAMGCLGRVECDIWGIVTDSEVEHEIFSCLGILLLGKSIEADSGEVGGREGDTGRIHYFNFRTFLQSQH
jgi:hypothetical protein